MSNDASGLPWPVHSLLVDYLEEGPYDVRVPGNVDDLYHVPSGLRFTEQIGFVSRETISLFVPPPETKETNTNPPLLRRLKRNIKDAMAVRRERRRLEWPLVEVSYFEISREELDTFDSLVRGIEQAAQDSPVDIDGASVWFFYGPERRVPPKVPPPDRPPSRRYTVELINTPLDKLSFAASNPMFPGLRNAWEAAWQHLQACCQRGRRVEPEEHWTMEPKLLARLLSAEEPEA